MTYRETCEGCAKRDAEAESLRAAVKAAEKGPRWVIDLSDDHAGAFALVVLFFAAIVALWWTFAGNTPQVLRAWVVVAVMVGMLLALVTRKR